MGCWTAKDQIACLRSIDGASLYAAQQSLTWNPIIDGTFLTGYPSQLIREGKYNSVPIITGTNTDEGFGIGNPNTDEELFHEAFRWRNYALSPPTIRRLMELYPNDPCNEPPHAITNCSLNPTKGAQYRRAVGLGGDITMVSGRRKMAELFTEANAAVYSYRFDQRIWSQDEWVGVKHFDNVAFSFQNISGELGPSPKYDEHAELGRVIGEAYIRFVNNLDPNPVTVDKGARDLKVPHWPIYDIAEPKNIVFNATEVWVEDDDWRKEGIDFINSYEVARELYG